MIFTSAEVVHATLCSEHTIPLNTIIDRSFCHRHQNGIFCISIVTSPELICDVTQANILTPYSSIVLARENWCEGDLH